MLADLALADMWARFIHRTIALHVSMRAEKHRRWTKRGENGQSDEVCQREKRCLFERDCMNTRHVTGGEVVAPLFPHPDFRRLASEAFFCRRTDEPPPCPRNPGLLTAQCGSSPRTL
jgi:hypothetical protein